MSRKMMVAKPLIMTASWGLSPMMSGNTNVAPNIATMCCAPRPIVRGQLRRSPGATAAPGAMFLPSPCSFHPNADMTHSSSGTPSGRVRCRRRGAGRLRSGFRLQALRERGDERLPVDAQRLLLVVVVEVSRELRDTQLLVLLQLLRVLL